jgi:hypothetical protein
LNLTGADRGYLIQRRRFSERSRFTRGLLPHAWGVSYRNLEEVLAVLGMSLEHGTLNRWEVDTRIWWLKLPDVESAPQIFHDAWMRYLRKV